MAGFFVAKIETVYIVIPSERLCRHIIGDPAPRRCVGPAKYFAIRQTIRVNRIVDTDFVVLGDSISNQNIAILLQ